MGPSPDLTVVVFRFVPPAGGDAMATVDEKEVDALNEMIASHVNSESAVYMSTTTIGGRFTLRFIALSSRTHLHHVDTAVASLQHAAKVVFDGYRTNRSLPRQRS